MRKKIVSNIRRLGLFNFGIVSLIFAIAGQYNLFFLKNTIWGCVFFFVAVITFFIAEYGSVDETQVLVERGRKVSPRKLSKIEVTIFIFIVMISLFFRTYRISEIPPACDRDEAKFSQDTIDIMNGVIPDGAYSSLPIYIKTLTDNPTLYNYYVSFVYAVFGQGDTQSRMAGAVMGILFVIGMYFLLRFLFGPGAAMAGGFLTAVMSWHITLSRLIYHAGFSVLVLVFVLYFMYRVIKRGKKFDYILLGITAGFSLYTYQAARIIPVILIIICSFSAIFHRGFWLKQRFNIFLAFTAFVILTSPLLTYMILHANDFLLRSRELFIFNKINMNLFLSAGLKNPVEVYLSSLRSALLMFNATGDGNIYHNLIPGAPMLGFFTGIFFIMGFFSLAFRPKLPYQAATLLFFLCALHGAVLFRGAYPGIGANASPESTRAVLVIPFIMIFSAAYISRMKDFLVQQSKTKTQYEFWAALSILLLFEANQSYGNYFIRPLKMANFYSLLNGDKKMAAEYINTLGADWHIITDMNFYEPYERSILIFYLAGPKTISVEIYNPETKLQNTKSAGMNIVYILKQDDASLLKKLWAEYPNGKYKEFYGPFGGSPFLFFSFEVRRL